MYIRDHKNFFVLMFIWVIASNLIFCSQAFAENGDKVDQVNILLLADIHFDPFIACNKRIPCPLIQKLRRARADQWPKLFALYDLEPAKYRFDTNYQLFSSALSESKKIMDEKHPQFVLALGDFLGHEYHEHYRRYSQDRSIRGYRSFVKKTFQFLTEELNQQFPKTDVYALIGNNDTYIRDYCSQPQGEFFRDIAGIWSKMIKNKNNSNAMQQDFAPGGYYAVDVPGQPTLRLIMLNSVLFSINSNEKVVDIAAKNELDWLQKQLQLAKLRKQKVIIAMHIPPSVDIYATVRIRLFTLLELWRPKYAERFLSELRDFAPDIMAVFAAHLHSDWFQILTFNESDNEIPMAGVPSISPIFGNNPGIKIYTYSSQNLKLGDFISYYYPLDRRTWGVEYSFNRIDTSNCKRCPVRWDIILGSK